MAQDRADPAILQVELGCCPGAWVGKPDSLSQPHCPTPSGSLLTVLTENKGPQVHLWVHPSDPATGPSFGVAPPVDIGLSNFPDCCCNKQISLPRMVRSRWTKPLIPTAKCYVGPLLLVALDWGFLSGASQTRRGVELQPSPVSSALPAQYISAALHWVSNRVLCCSARAGGPWAQAGEPSATPQPVTVGRSTAVLGRRFPV